MKILLQRVTSAAVHVEQREVATIGAGLLLLVGFGQGDDVRVLDKMVHRVVNCRVFADAHGRLQYSVLHRRGALLAVPQFTLYADTGRGRRPDFTAALPAEQARLLFNNFADALGQQGCTVKRGVFGADMKVTLVNDGPFTLLLES